MTPIERGSKRTITAYLACCVCGHWWGLTPKQLRSLMAPHYFTCPMCHQGRTKASAAVRRYPDRAEPAPPRLDTKELPGGEG